MNWKKESIVSKGIYQVWLPDKNVLSQENIYRSSGISVRVPAGNLWHIQTRTAQEQLIIKVFTREGNPNEWASNLKIRAGVNTPRLEGKR